MANSKRRVGRVRGSASTRFYQLSEEVVILRKIQKLSDEYILLINSNRRNVSGTLKAFDTRQELTVLHQEYRTTYG